MRAGPLRWKGAGTPKQAQPFGRAEEVKRLLLSVPPGDYYDFHFVNIKIGSNGSDFADPDSHLKIRRSMRRIAWMKTK
jgi:hypothetical protein